MSDSSSIDDAPRPTVAVAESCTGGMIALKVVEIPGSGEWFAGGVVAYHPYVKFEVLNVPEGPVVTAEAAREMAAGVARLMDTDVGISSTGSAGPEPEEGQPVGTVFVGVAQGKETFAVRLTLEGTPDQVRDGATEHAMGQISARRQGRLDDAPFMVAFPEGGCALHSSLPVREVSVMGNRASFTAIGEKGTTGRLTVTSLDDRTGSIAARLSTEEITISSSVPGGPYEIPAGVPLFLKWQGEDAPAVSGPGSGLGVLGGGGLP